jgi:hypothetical protein
MLQKFINNKYEQNCKDPDDIKENKSKLRTMLKLSRGGICGTECLDNKDYYENNFMSYGATAVIKLSQNSFKFKDKFIISNFLRLHSQQQILIEHIYTAIKTSLENTNVKISKSLEFKNYERNMIEKISSTNNVNEIIDILNNKKKRYRNDFTDFNFIKARILEENYFEKEKEKEIYINNLLETLHNHEIGTLSNNIKCLGTHIKNELDDDLYNSADDNINKLYTWRKIERSTKRNIQTSKIRYNKNNNSNSLLSNNNNNNQNKNKNKNFTNNNNSLIISNTIYPKGNISLSSKISSPVKSKSPLNENEKKEGRSRNKKYTVISEFHHFKKSDYINKMFNNVNLKNSLAENLSVAKKENNENNYLDTDEMYEKLNLNLKIDGIDFSKKKGLKEKEKKSSIFKSYEKKDVNNNNFNNKDIIKIIRDKSGKNNDSEFNIKLSHLNSSNKFDPSFDFNNINKKIENQEITEKINNFMKNNNHNNNKDYLNRNLIEEIKNEDKLGNKKLDFLNKKLKARIETKSNIDNLNKNKFKNEENKSDNLIININSNKEIKKENKLEEDLILLKRNNSHINKLEILEGISGESDIENIQANAKAYAEGEIEVEVEGILNKNQNKPKKQNGKKIISSDFKTQNQSKSKRKTKTSNKLINLKELNINSEFENNFGSLLKDSNKIYTSKEKFKFKFKKMNEDMKKYLSPQYEKGKNIQDFDNIKNKNFSKIIYDFISPNNIFTEKISFLKERRALSNNKKDYSTIFKNKKNLQNSKLEISPILNKIKINNEYMPNIELFSFNENININNNNNINRINNNKSNSINSNNNNKNKFNKNKEIKENKEAKNFKNKNNDYNDIKDLDEEDINNDNDNDNNKISNRKLFLLENKEIISIKTEEIENTNEINNDNDHDNDYDNYKVKYDNNNKINNIQKLQKKSSDNINNLTNLTVLKIKSNSINKKIKNKFNNKINAYENKDKNNNNNINNNDNKFNSLNNYLKYKTKTTIKTDIEVDKDKDKENDTNTKNSNYYLSKNSSFFMTNMNSVFNNINKNNINRNNVNNINNNNNNQIENLNYNNKNNNNNNNNNYDNNNNNNNEENYFENENDY